MGSQEVKYLLRGKPYRVRVILILWDLSSLIIEWLVDLVDLDREVPKDYEKISRQSGGRPNRILLRV